MKRNLKWIIPLLVVVLLLAAGGGVWYYLGHNSADPVYVYRFDFVGMTEYWGDTRESYGPVRTEGIQTVFLTDTQVITEIAVSQGDTVKKGDLLMSFDTTLSELAVERKRLEVEKVKLDIEDANARLREINNMRPMMDPPEQEEAPADLGVQLTEPYLLYVDEEHDGSCPAMAPVLWLRHDCVINRTVMEYARTAVEAQQNENARRPAETTEDGETTAPTAEPEHITVNEYYMIVKVTNRDMSRGGIVSWEGVRVISDGLKFFNADSFEDYTFEAPEVTEPEFDWIGSGYTYAQINQMRQEQQKTIKDLEFKLKMTEAEYSIMLAELSDGNVYAQTDGVVISLLDEDEARSMNQPILKVSGGGGFYVEGSVSELERDDLQIGQEVTINDWQNGGVYSGTVTQVRDFPNGESGYYGAGNPNATRYPFTVFVDESADLREGAYVSVEYTLDTQSNGVYLQNPFLRTEQGRSYVYVLGADGRLEQRTVVTGKSLWGSYTEILSGLSVEDQVAFPYGKNVRPGAKAVEGDLSNLYAY